MFKINIAAVLLKENKNPSDADIDAAMAGNLCRCGTYLRIRSAIHLAADMERKKNKSKDANGWLLLIILYEEIQRKQFTVQKTITVLSVIISFVVFMSFGFDNEPKSSKANKKATGKNAALMQ